MFLATGCHGDESEPPAVPLPDEPWLIENTEAVGLEFVHDAGDSLRYEMPQIMGSGCGLLDFDNDGRLDLYLVGGEASTDGGRRDRLFRRGDSETFTDVTDAVGLRSEGYGMGVAAGDFDNDGFTDLYVSGYGPDQLLHNNGDGTFADVTDAADIDAPGWGTAVCFCDYDRDGRLDLFVVHYVDYLPGQYCEDRSGRRDFCGPNVYPGTADRLFHNEGDGRFVEMTSAVGLDVDLGKGLGVACDDFNADGRPDFYVANDMEENHLWIQQPDGTFRNEALLRGAAVNALGESQASMGVVSADLTSDGRRDLFLTHLRGETNTLYESSDDGFFTDATARSGLGPNSRPSTGFGVAAIDMQHDGRLDVLVANGRVLRGPPPSDVDVDSFWSEYAEPNHFYRNDGSGRFHPAPELGGDFCKPVEVSRGLASGDLDGDGDIDFVVTNCGGPARAYANIAPKAGHWLIVRPIDTRMNRDAIGATVAVVADGKPFVRRIDPSSSYLTANDARAHFGLGQPDRFERIEVTWTDGVREEFPAGPADRVVTIVRRAKSPSEGNKR